MSSSQERSDGTGSRPSPGRRLASCGVLALLMFSSLVILSGEASSDPVVVDNADDTHTVVWDFDDPGSYVMGGLELVGGDAVLPLLNETDGDHEIGDYSAGNCTNVDLLAVPGSVIIGPGGQGGTYASEPGVGISDSYLSENWPTDNYGDSWSIFMDSEADKRLHPVMMFDVSSIPDVATVSDATLWLYQQAGSRGDDIVCNLHSLSKPFVESEVTWNRYAAGSFWDTPGGDYYPYSYGTFVLNNDQGWKGIDVAELVEAWARGLVENNGLILVPEPTATDCQKVFQSSDDHEPVENGPWLIVNYTIAGDAGLIESRALGPGSNASFTLSSFNASVMSHLDDGFEGDSLSSKWEWTNDPALGDGGYDVGQTRPGWLHVTGEGGTEIWGTTVTCNYLHQGVTGGFVASTYLEDHFEAESTGAGLLLYEDDSEWMYIAKEEQAAISRVHVVLCEGGVSVRVADIVWAGSSYAGLMIERNSTGVWFHSSQDGVSYYLAYHLENDSLLADDLSLGLFTYSNTLAEASVEFDHFTVSPVEEPTVEVRVRSGNSTSFSDPSWEDWDDAQVVTGVDVLDETAMYLQYRVLMYSPEEWCTPVFSGFDCWYEMRAAFGTIETQEHVPTDFSMWYTLTTNQSVHNGATRYWYSTDDGGSWVYAGSGGSYSITSTVASLKVRVEVETYDTLETPRLHSISAMHGTAMAYLTVSAPTEVVAGEPFAVTVYAKDSDNVTMVHWSGPITLTAMEVDASTPKETDLAIKSITITSGGYVTVPNEMYTVSGTMLIRAMAGSVYGFSAPITVSTGPVSSLSITPIVDVLLEDEEQEYTAEGLDAYGNVVPGLEYSWSVDPDIGTLDRYDGATVTLTAGNAGNSGYIGVSSSGLYASLFITITHTNNAPTFTEDIPDQTKLEDSGSWTIDLSPYVQDSVHPDSALRWFVTGEEIVDVSGENRTGNMAMTLSTLPDKAGEDLLTLSVVDPDGLSASTSFSVTIQPVNDWPVVSLVDPLVVRFDHLYIYNMRYYVTDVDNTEDELTLSTDADSAQYVYVIGLTLYMTYPMALNGTVQNIVATVSDGLASASTVISVAVTDDIVPVTVDALPDFHMNQGEELIDAFDVSEYFVDPDGDTLEYDFSAVHMSVYISSDNMVGFSAPTDWYGTESVVFSATDPSGARVESASTIVVHMVNQAPVISSVPDLIVKYDLAYEFDLTRYVSDPDNDIDDLHVVTNDVHAVPAGLVLTLEYPESMAGESVYLRMTVSDGELSDSAVTRVTVGDNAPPAVGAIPSHSFQEDLPVPYPASGGLGAYFEDEEGEELSYEVFMLTEGLEADVSEDGSGEWVVDFGTQPDWHGQAWFAVRATDPGGALVETMIELTVLSVPDAPSLSFNETVEVPAGAQRMVYLYSWASDPDEHGQGLSFAVSSDYSAYATVTEGVLVLQFPVDFLGGEDRKEVGITITVTDPDGLRDSDALQVAVVRVADDGRDPLLLLGMLAMAAVAAGSFIAAMRLRKRPFVIRDIMVIHNDGFLVGRAAEKRAGEIDEDILSGMLTAVLNFVEDSMAKTQDGLRSFGFEHYSVLVKRGRMTYMALVYEGDAPESVEDSLGELIAKVEKIYRKRMESWTGDMETDFAGIEVLLKAFVNENSRRSNGLKAI